MTRHLRRWGAAYILAILWVVSSLLFGLAETAVQTNEARQHGQPFQWSEFWPAYWSGYFENLQSEWLQLVFQAVLLLGAKHWLFKVDAEDLERIESKVNELLSRSRHTQ